MSGPSPTQESLIITKRKGLAAVGCVALIATASIACGSVKQVSAEMKISNAVEKLDGRKGVTAQLSIDATSDQIWAALKDESDFTRSDANTLAALRVSLTASADKPLKDLKSTDKHRVGVEFSTDSGKSNAIEVRSIDNLLYFRADLKSLAALGDAKGTDGAEIDSLIASADSLPSSLAAVKQALQGKWVALDPVAFGKFAESIAKQSGGKTPIPVPSANPLDAKTQALITAALRKAITHNAKFADAGSKNGEDHVTVTLQAGKAVRELTTALQPLEKQIPGLPLSGLNKAPDKKVTLDLAVKDGALSGVTVDLAQFNEKPATGKVPLHLAFSNPDGKVEVPAGAKEFKPEDLMDAVMQMMPELGGSLGA